MTIYCDISVGLKSDMPVWPDSVGYQLIPTMRMAEGDEANVSQLSCDLHVGTHVDAPWHFTPEGKTVETLALDTLIGKVFVADFRHLEVITAQDLDCANIPKNTERLLLHTRNSQLWVQEVKEFEPNFVAITADAAQWIVDHGIKLVGIDYLSIQRYQDSPLTHELLLKSEVIILEGLNLSNISSGIYQLICLPLKLVGADGAPARAILVKNEE